MSEAVSIYVTYGVFALVWYILQVIGHRGVFKKAGVSQGKAFIPLLREVEMFKLAWDKPNAGIIWLCSAIVGIVGIFVGSLTGIQVLAWIGCVAVIVALVLMIIRDVKQSHAFNGGGGMTAGLILLNPIFNIVLAKNTSEYKGKQK